MSSKRRHGSSAAAGAVYRGMPDLIGHFALRFIKAATKSGLMVIFKLMYSRIFCFLNQNMNQFNDWHRIGRVF
jgi:hypothetical protein